jgi:hypothetical protein
MLGSSREVVQLADPQEGLSSMMMMMMMTILLEQLF